MKIKILTALFSLLAVVSFSSCIGPDNSGPNHNENGDGTTPTLYELTVNGIVWTIHPSKVVLTDNAKKNPENYTSDYTLTIIAVDASNMVNQDSKRLDIDFNADDIAELKDTNIAEQEDFKIKYRSAKDIKTVEYKPLEGIFTVTEAEKKSITFVFNRLKLEGKSNNILLPGTENPTLTVQGEVKCSL
ncbi:MAG: hypothetical protein IKM12_04235 [Alistipes sp.]|nr:hypothetical protein [Alistipes sp.]